MKPMFAVVCLLSFCLTGIADGLDGKPGANGGSGADGSNGTATVNFTPTNATSSYPLYLPILNCDPRGVQASLTGGAQVNLPIYTSRKFTPVSVAIKYGCVAVLKAMIENPDTNNKPNFELTMFDYDGNTFNFYRDQLIGDESHIPNIAVRGDPLDKLQLILPTLTDAKRLAEMTSEVTKIIASSENKYAGFQNNLDAVSLIQNRLRELGFKK